MPCLLAPCAGAWWDLHAHSIPMLLSTKYERGWCVSYKISTQRRCPEALRGCPLTPRSPIPPCFLDSGGGARMRGQGKVIAVPRREAKGALQRSQDRAVFTRCAARRPDRIVHLDGVRPGTLGWCAERGCASEAGKMERKVLGSELSLKGWTRSRRGEGLKRGWKWALPIGMVWAGPKAERAWPGLGVGPKRGGSGVGRGLGSGRGACGGRA